jgi:hypothetical protein
MEIVVANRRRKSSKLKAEGPGAANSDVTSKDPRSCGGFSWVFENRLIGDIDRLRQIARKQTLALLDHETNVDLDHPSRPLSHAALVKLSRRCLAGTAPRSPHLTKSEFGTLLALYTEVSG